MSPKQLPTADQFRAARGLVNWHQSRLAEASGVSAMTIKRIENNLTAGVSPETVDRVAAALESAGVVFIAQNGQGPGVRLRDRQG